MKKIGFVDYDLNEWHADHYPDWIAEACAALGCDYRVAYAWAERTVTPKTGATAAQWCEAHGAELCDSINALCEKSDVIIVLAPSNPETHLRYAQAVLPYRKPTYIDKTFAPDYAAACAIFEIAEKYGTPFFSTSALRFADELDTLPQGGHLMVLGGGSNLPEYIIHEAEMAVKKVGASQRVCAQQRGGLTLLDVQAENGSATMIYAPSLPYALHWSAPGQPDRWVEVTSPFFPNLLRAIIRFFETGALPFDPNQTKDVIRLVERAVRAAAHPGVWVE